MENNQHEALERAVREAANEVQKEEVLSGKKEPVETPDEGVPTYEIPEEHMNVSPAEALAELEKEETK